MDFCRTIFMSTFLGIIFLDGRYASGHENHDHSSDIAMCPKDESLEVQHDHGSHGDHESHDHEHEHQDQEDCPTTSYKFDGVWYYERMPNSPELKDFTFTTYATSDASGKALGAIFNIHHASPSNSFAVFGSMQNDTGYLHINIEGQQKKVMTAFTPNTKHHIGITADTASNSVSVYIDGKFLKKISFSNITGIPGNGQVLIGKIEGDGALYKGTLQNMMVFGRTLSKKEIKEIHQHNRCLHDPLLILNEHSMIPMKYGVPTIKCAQEAYVFNNTGDRVEYLEATSTFPRLEFGTVCVKITTNARGAFQGTIASYATKDQPEGILATGFINSKGEAKNVFVVEGQKFILDGQYFPHTKYSLCAIYHFKHNHFMTYVNTYFLSLIKYKGKDHLPGGGKVIIGQRQLKLGRCFDYPFNGEMEDFMFWGRALSKKEMQGYMQGKCPNDQLVSSKSDDVIQHGNIYSYKVNA